MPIPQVNDRIKEAPVVVLRAVFAGIGQILLTADKVRARATEQVWAPDRTPSRAPAGLTADRRTAEPPRNGTTRTQPATKTPSVAKTAPTTKAAPTTKIAPVAKSASAAKTTPAAKAAPAAKAPPAAKTTRASKTAPAAKPPRVAAKGAKAVPAPQAAEPEPAGEAPPLPGYDDLSLASLRARLRVLDAPTIQAMLAYEKDHARREPVITMLERRLAKISAG